VSRSLIDFKESEPQIPQINNPWGIFVGQKQLLMAVAAGALALGISSAKAADIEPVAEPAGWYVSLFGGASWLEDVKTDYEFIGDTGSYHVDIGTDVGFIIGGAAGTHLTDDLRVEVEVAYSENDVDRLHYSRDSDGNSGNYDGHGQFGILTFMANLWYDVPLSDDFKPYVGGGAGVAIVDGEAGYDADVNVPDGFDTIFDDSKVAFAFQLGAGLRWQAWENVTLDVGYRLRGIDGPSFDSEVTFQDGTSSYDADWMWSHNVIAGISFGL
jgi:opacity protein-like surface antigen